MAFHKKWLVLRKIFIVTSLLLYSSMWAEECTRYDMIFQCTRNCGSSQECMDQCALNYKLNCQFQDNANSARAERKSQLNYLLSRQAEKIKKSPEYQTSQEELLKKRKTLDPNTFRCAVKNNGGYIFDDMKNNKYLKDLYGRQCRINFRIYDVDSIPYLFLISYASPLFFGEEVHILLYYPLSSCVNRSEITESKIDEALYSYAYVWGKILDLSTDFPHGYREGLNDFQLKEIEQHFLNDTTKEKLKWFDKE